MSVRVVLAVLSLMLLVGCGKPPIDDAFAPYVARFEEASSSFGSERAQVDTEIKFSDLGSEASGKCSPFYHRIEIDRKTWDQLDDAGREGLIMHELGHCMLGRQHRDDWQNGKAVSIMYHGYVGDYADRRAELLTELFN